MSKAPPIQKEEKPVCSTCYREQRRRLQTPGPQMQPRCNTISCFFFHSREGSPQRGCRSTCYIRAACVFIAARSPFDTIGKKLRRAREIFPQPAARSAPSAALRLWSYQAKKSPHRPSSDDPATAARTVTTAMVRTLRRRYSAVSVRFASAALFKTSAGASQQAAEARTGPHDNEPPLASGAAARGTQPLPTGGGGEEEENPPAPPPTLVHADDAHAKLHDIPSKATTTTTQLAKGRRAAAGRRRVSGSERTSARRVKIDIELMEDAMCAALVAVADCGAVREADCLLPASAAACSDDSIARRMGWLAALSALEGAGMLRRIGVWLVAAGVDDGQPPVFDEAAVPRATTTSSAVEVLAFRTTPLPLAFAQERRSRKLRKVRRLAEERRRKKLALQRRRTALVRSTRSARRCASSASAKSQRGGTPHHAAGNNAASAGALVFDAKKAAANARRTGVPVFVSWRKTKVKMDEKEEFIFNLVASDGAARVAVRGAKAGSRWKYSSDSAFMADYGLSTKLGHALIAARSQSQAVAWMQKLLGWPSTPPAAAPAAAAAAAAAAIPPRAATAAAAPPLVGAPDLHDDDDQQKKAKKQKKVTFAAAVHQLQLAEK